MNKRLHWILICSALLSFWIQLQRPSKVEQKPQSELTPWIIRQHQALRRVYAEREQADFLLSITLGEKRWLNPATKRLHQKFNLTHLFTPSGLHLGALLLILRPFLRAPLLRALLYLTPLSLSGFYSCKRVGLLFACKTLFKGLSLYFLFLFIMALDFAFGTYKLSPLSFLYSFTYFGIFLVSHVDSKLKLFISLLRAQIILGFFTGSLVAPLGILMGLILTPLFCAFFPLCFLGVFIKGLSPILSFLLTGWFKLLNLLPTPEFFIASSFPLVLLALFKERIPLKVSFLLLLIHSTPLGGPRKNERFLRERILPKTAVSQVIRKPYGYQVDSIKWGLRCRYELIQESWRASCRDLPAWKKRQKLVTNEGS